MAPLFLTLAGIAPLYGRPCLLILSALLKKRSIDLDRTFAND
jgi:hypothetical protein